ncbi:ABC transporter permease [Flavobacterium sp.]|uniref:ABC transporter permease n=1 Tax=Flavobacterium sp. TaxID=239 RepID=UPI0037520616
MLKNWINIFLYHIKNNKLFTTLNVLGLSIGIAGLIFATLYWNDEQNYDQWNPNKDDVFQVLVDFGKGSTFWTNTPVTIEPFVKNDPNIDKMIFVENWYNSLLYKYKGKKQIVEKVFNTQNDFFEFFPFKFIEGSAKTVFKDENSIALNQKTAALFFGTETAVGKQIQYENKTLTVTAVYEIPGNSSIAPNAIVNDMKGKIKENTDKWGNFNCGWFIKLKNPSKTSELSAKISSIYYQNKTIKEAKSEGITPEEYEKLYGSFNFILEPISGSRLHTKGQGMPEGKGNYQFLLIMVGLSILILILSIVNYVNLATANAIRRAKEVGIRKIVGASKLDIIKQFLFETIITVLFSILLSLVIVELTLPYYNEFLGKELIIFGGQFYGQLVLIFIITIVAAGVFPAIYVSNFETLKVLKGNFGRSKGGVWLRNGMLILQFAIASFFIIGSYIVYQQVNYLANKDLGFSGSQVLDISYNKPESIYGQKNYEQIIFNNYTTLKNEISKINGVEKVATGAFRFGGGNDSSSGFSHNGENIQAQNIAVDFDMLEMMKIPMVQGRYLDSKIASDTINSMMVNETALKMMNEKNPIGKNIDWNDNKFKIIGVVKDFSLFNPQGKVPPMVFFHFKTVSWMVGNLSDVYVKVKPENMEQTIADIEKFWVKNVDTEYPFKYDFVDKAYARTYETYVKQKNLFSLLNIIVILIALFGLFSLASFSIQRRMKEIVIRKTLGAETNVLLKELSKQYLVFCVIGFLIALFPVYYLLNLWLENFAFRIDISVIPFIIGFIVLLILTLVVVLSRAYQATRVDVLKYLKYE